jgi:hypothetical protein
MQSRQGVQRATGAACSGNLLYNARAVPCTARRSQQSQQSTNDRLCPSLATVVVPAYGGVEPRKLSLNRCKAAPGASVAAQESLQGECARLQLSYSLLLSLRLESGPHHEHTRMLGLRTITWMSHMSFAQSSSAEALCLQLHA